MLAQLRTLLRKQPHTAYRGRHRGRYTNVLIGQLTVQVMVS